MIGRRLSLRARLNALSAALLALGLAINVFALVAGASTRIDAEIASSMRLAGDFVEAALVNLRSGGPADPDVAIDRLVASLQNFRHVRIFREHAGQARSPVMSTDGGRSKDVPAWFAALLHPGDRTMRIAAVGGGHAFGTIVIASYPYDEMAEVWDGAKAQTLVGLALVLATYAVTFWLVDRSLAPLRAVSRGLGQLASGRFDMHLEPSGPPEFIDIGTKLNELSVTLATAETENRFLVQKLISVQDDERKQLARELHDEYGAHLFAIRANMTSLVMRTDELAGDQERFATTGRAILDLVDALQRLNRRILGRLRPMALGELGLAEAVRGLVAMWASGHPGMSIALDLGSVPEDLDEPTALTAYRLIQESLTNVVRHAHATRVEIRADLSAGQSTQEVTLHLVVNDNGQGMTPQAKPGLGLLGMRERVRGLGGRLWTSNSAGGGFRVEATIPIASLHSDAAALEQLEGDFANQAGREAQSGG